MQRILKPLHDLKPFYARWIVETYSHLKHQNDSIIEGLDASGIRGPDSDVFTLVENTFDEQRQQ